MKQVRFSNAMRAAALTGGLFLTASAFGQQVVVKGHVKDATGEPIIGATIRVDGTDGGTITDIDGNFSINADAKSTLKISYIGYETVSVAAGQNINVILKEDAATKLDDVVVIGYGRAKKTDLTGSITAMKPDELSKGITNNASDMLVGKVAGVDVQTTGGMPGAGAQIRIRGGASLSASNDPLYVIDGLVIDNNTAKGMSNILANINPNDIENFTVLKSASATAIYGSRASNGVVIITTKKGRSGQKPTFTYNGDFTISTALKKYKVLSGDQYRDLVESFGLSRDLLGTANTDWQDEILRTTLSTNHSISMQGGLKNMPYRVSAGYNIGNGILKTSWMRRFNSSVNIAPTFLNNHLNFNITAKYMYEKDRYADTGAVGAAIAMDPTRPVRMSDPEYSVVGGYYQTLVNASYNDPNWTKTSYSQTPQNPLAMLNNKYCLANANDFSGNAEVDYKIHGFEDLRLHASIGAQYTETEQTNDIRRTSYSNNYYGYKGLMAYYKYPLAELI
ncbi:MAG: SusC/RagA family TonB-linked outer membrane protein [Prevotella pectinovora]|uniref:SusC/RagA family TonB-linked outer membrane protein n=1 Tax=Prevotella pectinovora TaxID=1602169 RepID=UPI002E78E341|nr:SusC/RagA family TonB-linked outer membrane protein [Prevotella pectinovora]MEE1546770.1 SusC/RagA family TonB-linked outer membrane protein [Prevotella pectinovora]